MSTVVTSAAGSSESAGAYPPHNPSVRIGLENRELEGALFLRDARRETDLVELAGLNTPELSAGIVVRWSAMGHGTRFSPALWLGGFAAAGALAGHHAAYMLISNAVHGERLPAATGHHYFGWCAALALGMVMAALASFFRSRIRDGDRGQRPALLALHLAARLMPLQIAACLLLHGVERFLVAGELGGLLDDPRVIVGIVTQTATAVCAAVVLALLASVADLVARRSAGPRPRRARAVSAILPRVQVAPSPAVAVLAGTISHRGPPNAP